jgi:hypothetical protein
MSVNGLRPLLLLIKCVASVEKKNHRKKVTIIFFHIYYTRESHSVYNYFCFVFDVFVVIENNFDPGERLQAPGSLWFYYFLIRKSSMGENHIRLMSH